MGLLENLRLPAATLIYDTFLKKFRYTLGSRHKGIQFIANSLQCKYGYARRWNLYYSSPRRRAINSGTTALRSSVRRCSRTLGITLCHSG